MTPEIEHPPLPIADFLDRLRAENKRVVPGSLIWLPHPEKPGLEIAAVVVEGERRGPKN